MGYNANGDIVPPVWVINRKTVDNTVRSTPTVTIQCTHTSHICNMTCNHRRRMRESLKDCPIFFNGRWIIPCAVVAGGTKGGVTRDNFTEVLIEFERYLDSEEYNVDSDGVRTVSNEDWIPKAPVYTLTDWHDSRR